MHSIQRDLGFVLTLLSQLEEPPSETPFARRPRGNTSEMMIQATGPHLFNVSDVVYEECIVNTYE
jgi:hypothetical protein